MTEDDVILHAYYKKHVEPKILEDLEWDRSEWHYRVNSTRWFIRWRDKAIKNGFLEKLKFMKL